MNNPNFKLKRNLKYCQSHTGQESQLKMGGRARKTEGRARRERALKEKPETAPYLQIKSVPASQRIDPKTNHYILLIQPQKIRACGGQFTGDEAYEIAKAVKGWDWSLDENQRPLCLPALEALLDQICKCSSLKGGEA